jgi:Ca2+-transporting ATPase
LSSSSIVEGEEAKMMVLGVGPFSQWGRIRAHLVDEPSNTPLQDKLEEMVKVVGFVGMGVAILTFIVMIIYVFVKNESKGTGFVNAFIIAITIVVVAIPGTNLHRVIFFYVHPYTSA